MPQGLTKIQTRLSWSAQLLAAVILGQTLFFKFTGAEESVALFTELGVEPWGRLTLAVLELTNVALLLIPRTAAFGGAMTVGLMVGAIGAHLGPLGIEVAGDDGLLFAMASTAFVAGGIVAWTRRKELPLVGAFFVKD
ncbi:MAG: DoxX family protein [Planctomycetota bacterium]|jgi:hypothetical protein